MALQSCVEEENDLISQNCDVDCTEIIGKITTDNGTEPISNLKLMVEWSNLQYLGGTVRKKAVTRTDAKGNFRLKFYIRDDEEKSGLFRVKCEIDENKYLLSRYKNIGRAYDVSRDTVVKIAYNIPKKAFLKLNFLNLDYLQDKDTFSVDFSYETSTDFDQPFMGAYFSGDRESVPSTIMELAGNQKIKMVILKRINKIKTKKIDSILLEAGTTSDYIIDFKNRP